jgi:hypothetical protein
MYPVCSTNKMYIRGNRNNITTITSNVYRIKKTYIRGNQGYNYLVKNMYIRYREVNKVQLTRDSTVAIVQNIHSWNIEQSCSIFQNIEQSCSIFQLCILCTTATHQSRANKSSTTLTALYSSFYLGTRLT